MIKRFLRKWWRRLFAPDVKGLLLIRRGECLSERSLENLGQWSRDNRIFVHFCTDPDSYRLITLSDKPVGEIMQADTEALRELVGND